MTAGESSITVGGTTVSPTVRGTDLGITTGKLADNAVTDAKIAGVASGKITGSLPVAQVTGAATTGANTFTGSQAIAAGNLVLPNTTSSSSGVITLGGISFLHDFGSATSTFVGGLAGGAFTNTGANNTAVGYQSLKVNTGGAGNSALGYNALTANTTGNNNSAFGESSLANNSSGGSNSAFGYKSLTANTSGWYNTAFGDLSMYAATGGFQNSAFGHYSLAHNLTGGAAPSAPAAWLATPALITARSAPAAWPPTPPASSTLPWVWTACSIQIRL